MLFKDNLLKLKQEESVWCIIKKDMLFQIWNEENKSWGSIKHFQMISPKSKPDFYFFLQKKCPKKKVPFWSVICYLKKFAKYLKRWFCVTFPTTCLVIESWDKTLFVDCWRSILYNLKQSYFWRHHCVPSITKVLLEPWLGSLSTSQCICFPQGRTLSLKIVFSEKVEFREYE